MKRITWWPQVWLGMTFNWAVLVAYAAKTGEVSGPLFILYLGLIFWTVGYDTIYACQDNMAEPSTFFASFRMPVIGIINIGQSPLSYS